jgi:hypothetical protein
VFALGGELYRADDRYFGLAGAATFALGAALWLVALCFHLTVGEWAAAETASSGSIAPGYEPLRRWADALYAAHMLLGYSAAGLLGAALLAAAVTPRWFASAEVAVAAACALGFAAFRGGTFAPPILVHALTAAIGIAVVASA